MYFPVGWPKYLNVPTERDEKLVEVNSNRERQLFAVVTTQTVYIWHCNPCVLITSYRRADDAVVVLGTNKYVAWRPDSSSLVIATTGGHLLFFKVNVDDTYLYSSKHTNSVHYRVETTTADTVPIPSLSLSYNYTVHIPGDVTRLCCLRDELLVATGSGLLKRFRWEGHANERSDISIHSIPFSVDLQQSREILLEMPGLHFTHMEFSNLLGGLAVVLSDGRAAFISSDSQRYEPNHVHAVWAPEIKDITFVAINHRYKLLAFGRKNGQGIVYTVDEITGGMLLSHHITLSTHDYPEGCQALGPVAMMKWTPDGCALAMSWKKGGLSMWSTFGAKLLCTVGGEYGMSPQCCTKNPFQVQAMDWSMEGYRLWMVNGIPRKPACPENDQMQESNKPSTHLLQLMFVKSALTTNPLNLLTDSRMSPQCCTKNPFQVQAMDWSMEGYRLWMVNGIPRKPACPENDQMQESNKPSTHLLQLMFVKSALTTNPCMSNHEHLFLQGEDKLYLNTGDTILKTSNTDTAAGKSPVRHDAQIRSIGSQTEGPNKLIGNKQWQIVPVPFSYLTSNSPLKFAAVDRSGHCVCVAGKKGLAHCALFTKRWKLFGNISQENDMTVTGGLTWWRDFIVLACFNHYDEREEIRMYPRICNLDNAFATSIKVPSQVLLLNVFRDLLIIFCADYHISLYQIHRQDTQPNPTASITRIQDLSLSNFVPHPTSLTCITLTSLRSEITKSNNHAREAESLIINVAGRVLMLHRDRAKVINSEPSMKKRNEMPFCAPIVLASNVENLWAVSGVCHKKPHLMESLWLGCGATGMKVWLPLYPDGDEKHHGFLSKRIMLSFHLKIYPLAILFEDAVVLGAANDTLNFDTLSHYLNSFQPTNVPFSTLERTTQIYLHFILRQLLRRNLGIHALDIARSCTSLPYFPHVLELMLHEVLEEEATASEPIPDAMLPRVVAFIQEFPEYLQTVVHCSRKTEIALWPYLFNTVGNPRDLFQECLTTGVLQTAASYLIILQNLETIKISRQYATQLFDAALEHKEWRLCRDLQRFLRTIGPGDEEDELRSPLPLANPNVFPLTNPPLTPKDPGMPGFKFHKSIPRTRSVSGGGPKTQDKTPDTGGGADKKPSFSKKINNAESTAEDYYIDLILCRHARKLLAGCRLRDLGMFCAYLDFKLGKWLTKERMRAAKVDDMVHALQCLHRDFKWPMPTSASTIVPVSNPFKAACLSRSTSTSSSQNSSLIINGLANDISPSGRSSLSSPSTSGKGMGKSKLMRPQSLSESVVSEARTEEAILQHMSYRGSDDTSTLGTGEESASTFGDVDNLDDNMWNSNQNLQEIEKLSLQMVNLGPPQSLKELRHLFSIFLDANCLEWAFVIGILLRDLTAVSQVINSASILDSPLDVLGRMREGFSFLELWAATECPSYKPVLDAIQPQAQALSMIIERQPSPPHTPASTSSETSLSPMEIKRHSANLSESEEEVNKTPTREDVPLKTEAGSCAIS
ncbi:RAB6A-GEF complex partner protein 1-like [Anneissia japonica]|uniref:RAB6A-GEF complex partner protein 1-like n=1 Tax=Anneissia japonica TaxID=1529436 RepID=UPI0014257013|nr:RAB6A-GEF complex partner protein 1-like [Anneissia japonica]